MGFHSIIIDSCDHANTARDAIIIIIHCVEIICEYGQFVDKLRVFIV